MSDGKRVHTPTTAIELTGGVPPVGEPVPVRVQWKNVDMCADFVCVCGCNGHIDGEVYGRWSCPTCERSWSMNWQLLAYPVEPEERDIDMWTEATS